MHGEVVAEVGPPSERRPGFLRKAELNAILATRQADPQLRLDLAFLAGDTTDDLDSLA